MRRHKAWRGGTYHIEPAEREHGGRALHDKPHAKARQTTQFRAWTSKKDLTNRIKNQRKINSKSIKNRATINEKSTQNRSWRRLGDLPGASWKPCASWEAKKTFGSSVWEASWGGLGGLLGRLESQDGSKLGPKREVFGVPKRSENECIIGSLLGSTFS